MIFRRFTLLLLTGALALLAAVARAETLNVQLVLSDRGQPYQQFSAALRKALAGSHLDVDVAEIFITDAEYQSNGRKKADLVVAAGMRATDHFVAAHGDAPVLSVMIPKTGFDDLAADHSRAYPPGSLSAIYLNQTWERQFSFIRAALPKHDVVGMLYSPNTPVALPRLPRGMSLNAKSVRSADALFDALEYILSNSDVLLVIPDGEIYSSANVRNILLTSYRYKVPLIGISQAYVNAGALGAIFSTPEQLADQAARAIAAFASTRKLPEPQYPEQFSIALNPQVARSLGIMLDSPETIRERMMRGGEGQK